MILTLIGVFVERGKGTEETKGTNVSHYAIKFVGLMVARASRPG